MNELKVIGVSGESSVLDSSVIEELKASLHGELLRAGDAGYEEARRVWNGMIDRQPALIAPCTGARTW